MTDLAARLEAATDPAELEALGWKATRVLLGLLDRGASVPLPMQMLLGSSPSLSLDACKRLQETVLPGVRWVLDQRVGFAVVSLYRDPNLVGGAVSKIGGLIEAAWLAAMLRAKGL